MKRITQVTLPLLLVALFGLVVAVPAAFAQSTAAEYKARLVAGAAYPGARGEAEYEEYANGRRKIEAEVERLASSLNGQSLSVHINGALVSQAVVRRGEAKYKADTRLGQTVPVVSNGSTVEFKLGAATVAAGTFSGGPLVPEVEIKAVMMAGTSYPTARGEAEYEVKGTGASELEVEVKNVRVLSGQRLNVIINGAQVGTLTVNTKGTGKYKVSTQNGQIVPFINEGSSVSVEVAGVVVTAGVFGVNVPDDDDDNGGSSGGQGVDLETRLIGRGTYAAVRGEGDYELKASGYSELEVEVKRATMLSGQSLGVFIDGTQVGAMTVSSRGTAKYKITSQNGQTVPVVSNGALVEVRFGAATVASGTFVPER